MHSYRSYKRSIFIVLASGVLLWTAGQYSPAFGARAGHAPDAIWVHDALYSTIGTDTSFKSPPAHSTDVIFSFMGGGLEGQRSVAVYAPGDREYNGGRWHVMAVAFTSDGKVYFDPDNDGTSNFELTNAEDLVEAAEMGLLTIVDTGFYFECPLLPRRGR